MFTSFVYFWLIKTLRLFLKLLFFFLYRLQKYTDDWVTIRFWGFTEGHWFQQAGKSTCTCRFPCFISSYCTTWKHLRANWRTNFIAIWLSAYWWKCCSVCKEQQCWSTNIVHDTNQYTVYSCICTIKALFKAHWGLFTFGPQEV